MIIDENVQAALELRAGRGRDGGCTEMWDRAQSELMANTALDANETDDAHVIELTGDSPDTQHSPALDRSRVAWLAAAASFVFIIVGAALIANGITNQLAPPASDSGQSNDALVEGPGIVLHFAGTRVEEWQALSSDPTTFIVDSRLRTNEFSILYSVDRAVDVRSLGDLAPPSLACDLDNSCESEPGDIDSDRIGRVDSLVNEVRLVERLTGVGPGVQTTATFVWEDQDVIRIVGGCDTACVRIALQQLRVGNSGDVLVPPGSPGASTPGRILVGVFFIMLGAFSALNLKIGGEGANRRPKSVGWLSTITHQAWHDSESERSEESE